MASLVAKLSLNPYVQAKLLRLQIVLVGIARDFWKDAPSQQWLNWLKKVAGKPKENKRPSPSFQSQPAAHKNVVQEVKEKVAVVAAKPKPWSADRVQIIETVWGEGHALPGGEEYLDSLSSPLGINPDMSVLDLGAGLGDMARFLADKYKTYVTGMEQDNALATRGMVMSIAAGKSKQASVIGYDPAIYTAARKYDVIFAREVFFKIIGKEKFTKAVNSSLKNGGGQIVFTDYILDSSARDKPAVMKWLEHERGAAPMSMIETIKMWRGMGYDMRVAEDRTDEYKSLILKGLKEFTGFLTFNIPDTETRREVFHEISHWSHRMEAFHEGLKYCRFYAIKY